MVLIQNTNAEGISVTTTQGRHEVCVKVKGSFSRNASVSNVTNKRLTHEMESCLTHHNFRLARQGVRPAQVWKGKFVWIIVETGDTTIESELSNIRSLVWEALLNAFDIVYLAYKDLTDFEPDVSVHPSRKLVIEIPADNAGAGGLACHAVAGISVGRPLFLNLLRRWKRVIFSSWPSWLPTFPQLSDCNAVGATIEELIYGAGVPSAASLDQVYYYELCRNFWRPKLNRKIDWACDNEASCWGWWTVGFNNAFAIIIPTLLQSPLHYFGHDAKRFRHNMVKQIYKYFEFARHHDEPFVAWRSSRLPWDPSESVNDLMTALIVVSFESFGGLSWIRTLFRAFDTVPDVNETEAGTFRFQQCRDNVYTMWCIAAQADLHQFFCEKLKWTISQHALDNIETLYQVNPSYKVPDSDPFSD